jgi:competence protein ComGF
MKKISLVTLILMFISSAAFSQAQSDSLVIQELQQSVRQLRADIRKQKADKPKKWYAQVNSDSDIRLKELGEAITQQGKN